MLEALKSGGLAQTLRDLFLRFFPLSMPSGAYRVGAPDATSPILVTGNNRTTLDHLRRALGTESAYVLALDVGGSDLRSAAASGKVTVEKTLLALAVSGIESQISSRRLVVPVACAEHLASAPLLTSAGWEVVRGPVEVSELPAFLSSLAPTGANDNTVDTGDTGNADSAGTTSGASGASDASDSATPAPMPPPKPRTMRFPPRERLAVALSAALTSTLLFLAPLLLFGIAAALVALAVLWIGYLVIAAAYPLLPTRQGWVKGLILGVILASAAGGAHMLIVGSVQTSVALVLGVVVMGLWWGYSFIAP